MTTASLTPPTEGRVQLTSRDGAPWLTALAAVFVAGAAYLRIWGLPPDELDSPTDALGIPCPLCGGTRATLALVHGDLAAAWSWNPLVPALALVVLLLIGRAALGSLTGRWISVRAPGRVWLVLSGLVLIAVQVNQLLQADRLLGEAAA